MWVGNMKVEHIFPEDSGSEEERKEKIQAVYTDIQKMLYNEKKIMRVKEKKNREDYRKV